MVTKAKKALLASLSAFLCVMLTVFGLSMMSVSASKTAKADTAVAKVGSVTYGSLNEAIEAAKAGDTVTLLAGTTTDVVIEKNITFDLGGNTLTGTGTASKATLTIAKGATVTVTNGTILGTANKYYTIQNNGTATFEDLTATADESNTTASMIDNWGTLTITSGTYTGGLNTVKSEEGTTLTITGGKFVSNYAPANNVTGTILVYGTTTISGGEFIQNSTSTAARVVVTGLVEGYTSITTVIGGSFANKSSGNIFHGLGKATSANFEVSGGTFNKSISAGFCANGFIPTKNADGIYGVKAGKYVAKIGSTNYETLDSALAALNSSKYTLTLLDESVWDVNTPVYWKVNATKNGYVKTLAEALTAIYTANVSVTCKIVCRPGADVGALTHGHVADSINIYGNNAYISGGECDLEVDTFMYSRETGKQVNEGGAYLDKTTITINAYELDNLGVWGERHTSSTVKVNLTDCDSVNGITAQRVYISGTTGVNNLTIKKCDFTTKGTSIYSNADGKITVENCSFTGVQAPLNINHKAGGNVELNISKSTFNSCGDDGDWAKFAAPARFVNSADGTMTITANNLKFNGTVGNNGDILLGDGRENQKSNDLTLNVTNTAANIQAQKPGYYKNDGTTDSIYGVEKTLEQSSTTYSTTVTDLIPNYVARVGDVGYETLQAAIDAAKSGATVTLLSFVEENITIAKDIILDLNGYTINGGTENGKATITVAANVTIMDSSASAIENGTGTIKREDTAENSGISSHYVIYVKNGCLTFNGGNVENDSGTEDKAKGASLICVGGYETAKLIVNNGTFTQNRFIAIKVDDYGTLEFNGGTIYSDSYAIENWNVATIEGGTVNGSVAAWTYSGGASSSLTISGGMINGDVTSVNYGNTANVATVAIKGGTITGELDTRSYDPKAEELTSISDAEKATIAVSSGTFSSEVNKDYLADRYVINKNADNTYGVAQGEGFVSVSIVLNESLSMKVALTKNESTYLSISYKGFDGETYGTTIDSDGTLYYMFNDIMPQMIDIGFTFELYGANGVMLDRKVNYSIIDYLDYIVTNNGTDAIQNLAASLIQYANTAKEIKGLTAIDPDFYDWKTVYNAFTAGNTIPAETDTVISDGVKIITKANVTFDNAYTLSFYLSDEAKAAGGYTYKFKDGDAIMFDENGVYTITVKAADISTLYTIEVYNNENVKVQTVQYSVSVYCIRKQNPETSYSKLYIATYYYGVAVDQYA